LISLTCRSADPSAFDFCLIVFPSKEMMSHKPSLSNLADLSHGR